MKFTEAVKRFIRRVGAADVDTYSSGAGSLTYGTLRTPSSKGLFGSTVDDKELLFAVQREPAAYRIVFGVAKDTLDNWFSIELIGKDDKGEVNDKVQKELNRLQAKMKLVKLLTLKRLFGYSILLLGYEDSSKSLDEEVSNKNSIINYIEPYSKMEINRFIDVNDPDDYRDGYPEYYIMKKSAGLASDQVKVHYTRGVWCSTVPVDHRYKGWSVLQNLYDDLTGFRYMRYGFYQTMIRYGSGFPDVTLKGPEANQAAVNAFIASGQFDNLSGMKYFVHNETQELEFKGFSSASLNPTNYYQIAIETLSMGSGIPEPVLKGAQAGALVGSEVNERAYFKIISDEQTDFEQVLRELVDAILLSVGEGTEDEPLQYKFVWKPSYEPTAKEKAELDFLIAQTAEKELLCQTVDEVRKNRYKLPALKDDLGKEVIGLRKPEPISMPQFDEQGNPINQPEKGVTPKALAPFANAVKSASAKEKPQPTEDGSGADVSEEQKDKAEATDKPESPVEKQISRTLPMLMRELGTSVMEGTITKEEAHSRGQNMITEYARLEQEQALLWIKHRTNFPGVVIIPPEMQRKLDTQRKQFVKDLDEMLLDAEEVFKRSKQPQGIAS